LKKIIFDHPPDSPKFNTFLSSIYLKTCDFFKLYNNNYRPIFHLEGYFIYVIKTLRESEGNS
jgi:hypothetical protein